MIEGFGKPYGKRNLMLANLSLAKFKFELKLYPCRLLGFGSHWPAHLIGTVYEQLLLLGDVTHPTYISIFSTERYKKQQESVNSWFKRPVAPIPKFERKVGESDRAFYNRVEQESNDFMKIARFENENECKVVQTESGEIEVEKRVRRKQIKNKE